MQCLNTGHKNDNLFQALQCSVHKNTRMTRATCAISCNVMHATKNTEESKKLYTILPVMYVKE